MSYDPHSYERNFSNCVEKPEKFRTSTGFQTRDLAMPVRRSNQPRYEATDVGSWSFVGPKVRVMIENTYRKVVKQVYLHREIVKKRGGQTLHSSRHSVQEN